MGTGISIIILVLHIYSDLYCLYINILIDLPLPITTTTDQLLVISLVTAKKSKVNYTVLF